MFRQPNSFYISSGEPQSSSVPPTPKLGYLNDRANSNSDALINGCTLLIPAAITEAGSFLLLTISSVIRETIEKSIKHKPIRKFYRRGPEDDKNRQNTRQRVV